MWKGSASTLQWELNHAWEPFQLPWDKHNVLLFTWKTFISTDLTNIYVLESICSRNLHIFQCDFIFVKPHDVLCVNVQTEMRFGVEQLLFPEGRRMIIKWKYFLRYWSFVKGINRWPVTCGFPSQKPVMRSFDVFYDLPLNKRLSKQSHPQWFETPSRSLRRHCNDIYHPRAYKWYSPAPWSIKQRSDKSMQGIYYQDILQGQSKHRDIYIGNCTWPLHCLTNHSIGYIELSCHSRKQHTTEFV